VLDFGDTSVLKEQNLMRDETFETPIKPACFRQGWFDPFYCVYHRKIVDNLTFFDNNEYLSFFSFTCRIKTCIRLLPISTIFKILTPKVCYGFISKATSVWSDAPKQPPCKCTPSTDIKLAYP